MRRAEISITPSRDELLDFRIGGELLVGQQILKRRKPGVKVIRATVKFLGQTVSFQRGTKAICPIWPIEQPQLVQMNSHRKDLRMPGFLKHRFIHLRTPDMVPTDPAQRRPMGLRPRPTTQSQARQPNKVV